MGKRYFLFIIIISLMMIVGCSNNIMKKNDVKRTNELSVYKDIDNTIEDDTNGIKVNIDVTYNGRDIKAVITNNGSNKLFTGKPYTIEKMKDDTWYQTKFTFKKGFNDIGIHIKPVGTYTQEEKLKLSKGKYRLIKEVSIYGEENSSVIIGDIFTVE